MPLTTETPRSASLAKPSAHAPPLRTGSIASCVLGTPIAWSCCASSAGDSGRSDQRQTASRCWREAGGFGLDSEAGLMPGGSSAGYAVVLSGLTVAVGLLSLIVLPVPFLGSVGYGGVLISLVVVVAATTLLPATVATWG